MKYTKVIFLFLLVSLFQNCNQKNDVDTPKELHRIEVNKVFLLSEVNESQFKALDTIDLEGHGNPPLTLIQDIAFAKDFIFLLDRKHGFLKFDYDGNFLLTIGKNGEGPNEYLVPTSIYLVEEENLALVADWNNMVVNSYDLEGNFISSSKKLPGRPISFYKEKDRVLVVQEGIDTDDIDRQTVLVSSVDPTTLEFKYQESILYSFTSKFNRIHSFLNVFGQLNDKRLFYFPRVRFEGLTQNKDTIYRVEKENLIPEYQLDFTDFQKSDTVRIMFTEINEGYASLLLGYNKKSYHLILDLESRTPKYSKRLPWETYFIEEFPKHLNADIYYAIIKNMDGHEEKNPKIVLYNLSTETSTQIKEKVLH